MNLPQKFSHRILTATGASSLVVSDVLQELWSGYGQILRLTLTGGCYQTVVAKYIVPSLDRAHPRGWNSELSHQRKVRSYQVESTWYRDYQSAGQTHRGEGEPGELPQLDPTRCRTPRLLDHCQHEGQTLLLLEDLDAAGYRARLTSPDPAQIKLCLHWLAEFHAAYLTESRQSPPGLWEVGTYWHLATRPGELAALTGRDEALQAAAPALDRALSSARFQTLVHGDAKLANFCFTADTDPSRQRVAALDFQYVGGGCGVKDVAYFLGSCLDEPGITRLESELLEAYFGFLTAALLQQGNGVDPEPVIAEWRALYPVACTDFHRFLKGWSPTHWKLTSHSERRAQEVIRQLTTPQGDCQIETK